MAATDSIEGFFRIWRHNGHQIRVEVEKMDRIDEILFQPNPTCSKQAVGVVQISITQFLVEDIMWADFDSAVDRGSPLFVDFEHYLADKGEAVNALYVGDSFVPMGLAGRLSRSTLLSAFIVVHMFLQFL